MSPSHYGGCTHDKIVFYSKREAKQYARSRGWAREMRAYRCADRPSTWHLTTNRNTDDVAWFREKDRRPDETA